MQLSVIIPTLNEAEQVTATLGSVIPLRSLLAMEIVIADGGSSDGTPELAGALADRVILAPRGRALQMNMGAARARGEYLLFLHADTRFSVAAARALGAAIGAGVAWGRFEVALSGSRPLLRVVEALMNLRSRLTGIATGDQAIFVRRDVFERIGGFPPIPLMEDIALSRMLKRLAWPTCLPERVRTSSRRWERFGIWRTILLMWELRLRYFLGADPARLAKRYHAAR